MNPNTDDVFVILARLEAKVDVSLTQHGANIEQAAKTLDDHEKRIRAVERTPTVSPKQLGAVVLAVIGALGAAYPFMDRFYN